MSDGEAPAELYNPSECIVVGLGASAGGVETLQAFFRHVQADSGMAYVVILHLSPDHDSQLAAILQAVTPMPVTQVTEAIRIMPNHVYVVPPNQHLMMVDGSLAVSVNTSSQERRAPIDLFFRTLAESHGTHAVCVVLSGTGANGSMGLKRVKERGGAVFVQNPREALFNEMPRNAIATDLVDDVLPVAELPERIRTYAAGLGAVAMSMDALQRADMQQQALREVFTHLRVRTGHDFSQYKRATLLRRIERRITVRDLPDLPAYAAFLRDTPEETQALLKDLLISVTNFFRDPTAFATLEQDILPRIMRHKHTEEPVRVWVVGCATGEEAYSIAMLLAERTFDLLDAPTVQIFATDIDNAALAHAREGRYSFNDVADVSPERLDRFFTIDGDAYRIRREIRELVVFANHNVLKDPPFSQLDLAMCRNVLIYFTTTAQERVMETFHFALNPGGYLFLGSSESVDGASDLYTVVSREQHLFQSRQTGRRTPSLSEPVPPPHIHPPRMTPSKVQQPQALERISYGDLHQRLLEQYAPPSIVVNEAYDIVHLSERAGRYLHIGGGELSNNLLTLIRPELRLELRTALYQAVQQRVTVEARGLTVHIDERSEEITLLVRPVWDPEDPARGFVLVLFEPSTPTSSDGAVLVRSDASAMRQLEDELLRMKAQLQASNEQHEFQAEELKASNEELQTMNEELRSSAEELETSKEEIQSTNEELRTVNQELKVKIDEITHTRNNLQNLVNSTNIATLFLDRTFRINLFTPTTRDLFNLIPTDTGRSLSDITNRLVDVDLLTDAHTVVETLHTIEREVHTTDQRAFLMRVLPYRTQDDHINGVVITFLDITERQRVQAALHESEERLRLVIESAKDYAIFTLDSERRVRSWNSGAEAIFGYTPSEILGQSGDIVFVPEDRERGVPASEVQTARDQGRAENERWHLRNDGSRFYGSGSTMPLHDHTGTRVGFVKIMRDLTDRKRAEEARSFLASIVDSSQDSIVSITFDRIITSWNKAAEDLYGYRADEAIGRSLMMVTLPEDLQNLLSNIERVKHSRTVEIYDTIRVHKGGREMHLEVVLSPVKDSAGEVIGVSTIARDVTERRQAEAAARASQEQLKAITNLVPDLLWSNDPTGVTDWYNQRWFDYTGQSIEQATRYGWLDALHPDDREISLRTFQEAVDTGMPLQQEHRIRGKDGRYRWFLVHAEPLSDDHGQIVRWYGAATDIEEHRHREQLVRESEARFRTLADAVPQVIWSNTADGVANYFNQRWYEYSGLSYEESAGPGWQAIVHPDDAPVSAELWQRALVTGDVFDTEYRLRSVDGSYRWYIGRNVPVRDAQGQITGWFGSATDIEDLKQAEQAVRESEERFRLLVEGAHDYAMFLLDADYRITFWSIGAERVFGWSEAEVLGQSGSIIYTPEDRDRGMEEIGIAVTNGRAEDRRWHVRKDGSRLFLDGMLIRLDHDNGQLRGFVKIGRDTTVLQQAEEALQRAYAQLEQRVVERTAALAETNQSLEQEIRERRRIEVQRTALIQRIITVQEEERQRISRELHDSLGQFLSALAVRISTLHTKAEELPEVASGLQNLQDVARGIDRELDRLTMELRPPALSDLGLEEALREYTAEWTAISSIPVDLLTQGLKGERLPAMVETTIYRIVQEALTNALKYAQATQISIIFERRAELLRMVIEDNGRGFDIETIRQERGGGRQVGLLGMAERATLVGGTLTIESEPGSGTTIYLTIPVSGAPTGGRAESA